MKVLWITNTPFPEVCTVLGIKAPATVGWVYSAANALREQNPRIELAVASCSFVNEFKEIEANGIIHYVIPYKLGEDIKNSRTDQFWLYIKKQFNPDVVHINGTEYFHSYSYIKAAGPDKVVISIQGLVSVYEKYYYGNIEKSDLLKSITIRDILRFNTIFSQRKDMKNRGKYERLLVQKTNHVIGRTSWDKAHIWAINPDCKFHFCNETLRASFYNNQWSINNCERHSIFISQAYFPIKGFHQLIKALPVVLRHFPKTKIYVAGYNFFTNKGLRISGYGNYINKLISKLKVEEHIVFTGLLSEEAMCEQFLKSHVFVSPSAIENSPNSVGEAQLLGVPCIASYVGGTPDMIEHGETGLLYRYDEVEMLAANICRLFSDDVFAQEISAKSKISAGKRHNRKQNAESLYKIYSNIIADN